MLDAATDPLVSLPCGRFARAVPGEEAGSVRLVIAEPSLRDKLLAAGCSADECDAGERLANDWREAGIVGYGSCAFSRQGRGGSAAIEDRVDEPAWRAYQGAMKAAGADRRHVAAIVLGDSKITPLAVPALRRGLSAMARHYRRR